MDCPHCGGWIDGGTPQTLRHPCFDDHWHHIVVGDQRRPVSAMAWRALGLLRQRFRRFVPVGFLAQHSARNPADGGSVDSLKVTIGQVRAKLAGTPFTIATQYGFGYALFPTDEATIVIDRNGRHFVRASERSFASLTELEPSWPLEQFDELHRATTALAGPKPGPRHPRKGPLFIARPRSN
jgi:hypothetical protein